LLNDALITEDSQEVKVGTGALKLDGNDDYVTLTGYKGISGNRPRSISAWIKTSRKGVNQEIINWGGFISGDEGGKLLLVRVDKDSGALSVGVAPPGYLVGSTVINDGQWHHITIVIPNEGYLNDVMLYVDGSLETIASITDCMINTISDSDVTIGIWPVNGKTINPYKGIIDDLRIYDRALKTEEITEIVNDQ